MAFKGFSVQEVPRVGVTWIKRTMGLPNIVYYVEDENDPDTTTFLLDEQEKAVRKLAKLKPGWTFYISGIGYRQSKEVAAYINVCHGQEHLGWIGATRYGRGGEDNIQLGNHSISKSLQRGDHLETKSATRAVQAVLKHFTPLPLAEKLKPRVEALRRVVMLENSNAGQTKAQLRADIMNALMPLLGEGDQRLMALLQAVMPAGVVDAVPDILTREQWAGTLYQQAVYTKEGTFVFLEPDGVYLLVKKYGQPDMAAVRHSSVTLPDKYRGGIGMLKIVEDDTVLDGIGARLNADTFFLLDV